ncbi:ESCRT-I subunit protein VPS28 TDEL_0B03170 [Torulaspora delbrueckii]|uniref:Vacuolar protein sorting-associated protein 28 n=1 Tax=Torulaspora delbrueckii TaxID=4950 RepID=G8ZPA2_TORDE|nr:hypothetical protein TDEL_0B03170 [Torulaspora delbrueckii]CCE90446.1 hypothetical protein TDEL_0B03170 [Torulaspora delbrueckii]
MDEIPLYDRDIGLKERETIETLSEIYSIIITIDQVEKLYIKDVIDNEQEYTQLVNKLLAQYNTLIANNENDPDFRQKFGSSINEFTKKYNVIASTGVIRLEKGIPMTVEHNNNTVGNGTNANSKNVAEATGNFITIMDAIKLNYRTKDQLHPLLAELLLSINRVTPLQRNNTQGDQDTAGSQSGEGNKKKLVEWIVKINKMKIDQELDDKDAKELLFDLDVAYKNFYSLLS